MRKTIVAGNWKMNGSIMDTKKIIIGTIARLWDVSFPDNLEVVFIPPYIYIPLASELVRDSKYSIGSQNMYFEDKGAFTGEISPVMLKEFNVKYVVIGHSERRHIFGETNDLISKKIGKAVDKGLVPILCVGETLAERELGKTWDVILEQLQTALSNFNEVPELVIAYEPVWAIGTGKAATREDAEEIIVSIREWLREKFGHSDISILYGGSVKPSNVEDFATSPEIDGALVGGASLKPEDFAIIVKTFVRRSD